MAVTSIGIHLLTHRKAAEAERAQISAQISILESTAQRLKSGEVIPDREFERLRRLARSQEIPRVSSDEGVERETIGWRDVLLGRKEAESSAADKWDRNDLEKGRRCAPIH